VLILGAPQRNFKPQKQKSSPEAALNLHKRL
jgi:hypothetical protein